MELWGGNERQPFLLEHNIHLHYFLPFPPEIWHVDMIHTTNKAQGTWLDSGHWGSEFRSSPAWCFPTCNTASLCLSLLLCTVLAVCNSLGFLAGSVVKNPSGNAGDVRDTGLIPGWGRPPGGGNGNLLQYPGIPGNPMVRGAQQATIHGVQKSQTSLSMHACAHTHIHTHTHTHIRTHTHTHTH